MNLDPLNRRTDRYGGDTRGRARLLLEVLSAVRGTLPTGKALAVKLNASDLERGGLEADEVVRIGTWCAEQGADCIELSGGSYRRLYIAGERPGAHAANWRGEAYFRDAAILMAARVGVPIALTGGLRDRATMDELVEGGVALLGMARPFCVAPDAARQLLDGTLDTLSQLPAARAYGRGPLGPGSWSRRVRRLNAFAAQAWYSEQLQRLAHGEDADPDLPGRRALRQMMARDRQWLSTTSP